MLMAGAAQSAGIVVRYALCPLATPAQSKGDGGEDAVVRTELGEGGINGEAKNSRPVLEERCSGEGLGCDVGKVVSSADFGDKDAPRLFGVPNHGVTR